MKRNKALKVIRYSVLAVISALMLSLPVCAFERTETDSYIYYSDNAITAAPDAYIFDIEITAEMLGASGADFSDVKSDGELIYLLDKSGGRILTFRRDGTEVGILGEKAGMNSPEGLFVSSDGFIYVADTGNARIVKFYPDGRIAAVVPAPDPEKTLSTVPYAPVKVVVDDAKRLYVLSKDETNGILQLGEDGTFYGFFGSVPVVPSLSELFWRKISTKEQLSRMLLFIPTEYSGLDIDESGFIYTTVSTNTDSEMREFLSTSSGQLAPVRRLNPKGSDVMLRNGVIPPMGDAVFQESTNRETNASKLIEVAYFDNGIYSVLDETRCRVFTYDSDGNMLYEFGSSGSLKGNIISPTAFCYVNSDIAVLDGSSKSLKIYIQTEYAKTVNNAVISEKKGDYETAAKAWNDVSEECAGSYIAYCGKARQAIRDRNYKLAMHFYRLADDKDGYSKSFGLYRQQLGLKATGPVIIGIAAVLVIVFVLSILRKHRKAKLHKKYTRLNSIKEKTFYGFYIMRHPFDGFWDMSFENRGSVAGATVILASVVLLNLIAAVATGYVVAGSQPVSAKLLFSGFAGILIPVGLWCLANWAVTSLMNGSGTMKRIYMYTCYSLTPLLIGFPLLIAMSNIITLEEIMLYNNFQLIMYVWMAFLLFAGTTVVHQYNAGKTLLTIFVIFVAIGIIVFLFLLCVTIFQQMSDFIKRLVEEISLRS